VIAGAGGGGGGWVGGHPSGWSAESHVSGGWAVGGGESGGPDTGAGSDPGGWMSDGARRAGPDASGGDGWPHAHDPNPAAGPAGPADADNAAPDHHWYDDEAGPLVRLYALTRGRARPVREVFDLIALIAARERPGAREVFGPEHTAVLNLCAAAKRSVADLAADCDLPVGVIRVILSDLLEVGCVEVTRPSPPASLPDQRILQEVINGLRAL
jgi:hypothetical protein